MRKQAKHLLAVLRQMLSPMPSLPSPERLRLEEAMRALDKAMEADHGENQ